MWKQILVSLKPTQRTYVGLAYSRQQKNEGITTIDRSLKSFQHVINGPSNTISEISDGAGIVNEQGPVFKVVNAGVGSALLIKLPPDTQIVAAAGSAVGCSTQVTSRLSVDNTILKAVGRKLVGDRLFYQKHYTSHKAGDILLAPQRIGEITTIDLKGSTKYVLRHESFLAKTEKVTINAGISSNQDGFLNKLIHTVSGPGTLAISHYGGIYRVSLAAGEEYQANPRNLIMWDKRISPTKLQSNHSLVPSARSKLRNYKVIRNVVDSPSVQPKLQTINNIGRYIRNLLLGTPSFVKLKGPGDFYLASRVEPFFEKSRLMNSLAMFNDSASQIFEKSREDIPEPPIENAEPANRSKPRSYAQRSIDGRPSFVAEVNSKGEITFVSAKK